MTLIAFATYGADRVEFITDSASYSLRLGGGLGRCTKSLPLPHLDAAVLTQGDSFLGIQAKGTAAQVAGQVATFDDLVDSAEDWLPDIWARHEADGNVNERTGLTTFLVGWSDGAEKFTGWYFSNEDGFKAVKVPGLFVTPSPWTIRPSRVELETLKRVEADHPLLEQVVSIWSKNPAQPAPRSQEEWVKLAVEARAQRAVDADFARVIVAGDVFHTRIKRGSIETRKIHTFNDYGEEFLRLVQHTEHPIALAGPCHCDSGLSYGDCHGPEEPCSCWSGKPFGDCHGSSSRHEYAAGERLSALGLSDHPR